MGKGAGSFQAKHPRSNPAQRKCHMVHVLPRVLTIVSACCFSARRRSGSAGFNLIRASGSAQVGRHPQRPRRQLKKCPARHEWGARLSHSPTWKEKFKAERKKHLAFDPAPAFGVRLSTFATMQHSLYLPELSPDAGSFFQRNILTKFGYLRH